MVHLKALIVAALVATASSAPFRPPSPSAASAISAFYKNNRFKGAFLTCSIKACSADAIAQYIAAGRQKLEDDDIVDKKDNALSKLNPLRKTRGGDMALAVKKQASFDLRRSLAFFLYGGFYQGCVGEIIYNNIFPLLGTGTDIKTVAKKVVADTGVISPMMCIPSKCNGSLEISCNRVLPIFITTN